MALDLVCFRKELLRGTRALLGLKLSRIDRLIAVAEPRKFVLDTTCLSMPLGDGEAAAFAKFSAWAALGLYTHVPTPGAATLTQDSGARLPRLVPFREVAQRVALSRSMIWRMERAGRFPKRRRLSLNTVAWWEPEIEEWLRNR